MGWIDPRAGGTPGKVMSKSSCGRNLSAVRAWFSLFRISSSICCFRRLRLETGDGHGMENKIRQIKQSFEEDLRAALPTGRIADIRIKYLSRRQGKIPSLLQEFRDLPSEQKPAYRAKVSRARPARRENPSGSAMAISERAFRSISTPAVRSPPMKVP